jgi:glycosyltransferase involved in cell wall biosynthesis
LLKCGYGTRLEGPRIVNTGAVPEAWMPILYNAADVLLLTSEYEGFGMPLLEAMACGTPIVASRVASIPEVLGDSGELVDLDAQDCIATFAERILHVLDQDARNLKGHARSRAFSWEQTAKRTRDVYHQLLE